MTKIDAAAPLIPATADMDPADQEWFRQAVFYALQVRTFADANADGIGDISGLTGKLDYLQWLGVDCVIVPPLFRSPMTDGGFDVADYYDIQPAVGTVEEFRQFVAAAHARGLRVLMDFVLNHTSDQHPWFQRSRTDPEGPFGNFYVWADGAAEQDPDIYAEARVLSSDPEQSNWTFDEVRGQHYWHRFLPSQPDLNFDNPHVLDEVKNAFRFWLALDVDGFRLDAVSYLVEAEATTCENLPGTHQVLRELRALIDQEFPGRILVGEADQPLDEIVDYFGAGDECHMMLLFPLVPQLLLAVGQSTRAPLTDLLASTPRIPATCQWATFLSTHNEVALAMLSPPQRELLWSLYAPQPRMIHNLGIRRRLAGLLAGDIGRIRLLHGLILSLPGSPVLYYGDEIAMGDDIWLADRDGVRTPMQWTAETGAGFSAAVLQDFAVPLVSDPDFAGVNVEDQFLDPGSLLVWLRSMLVIRRAHPVFGSGEITDLGGDNPAVLSFLRTHPDHPTVVCINNFSPHQQQVVLDLTPFASAVPVDLLRAVTHRQIGSAPFELSVRGHGLVWLRLPPAPPRERRS